MQSTPTHRRLWTVSPDTLKYFNKQLHAYHQALAQSLADAHNLAIDDRAHATATLENYRLDLLLSLNTFGRHASNFAEAQQRDLAAFRHLYAQHMDDNTSPDPSSLRDRPPEPPRIAPSLSQPPAMILDTHTHGRETSNGAISLATQGSLQIPEPPRSMLTTPLALRPSAPSVPTHQGSTHNTPHVLAHTPHNSVPVTPAPHESPGQTTSIQIHDAHPSHERPVPSTGAFGLHNGELWTHRSIDVNAPRTTRSQAAATHQHDPLRFHH